MRYRSLLAAAVLLLPTMTFAQSATTAPMPDAPIAPIPATLPTTEPTTMPTSRPAPHIESPPPGFVRVTVGRYSAFCDPADADWVKQGLVVAKPQHLPTTRPADILANCAVQRAAICSGLAHDLDVDVDTVGSQLFGDHIVPDLKNLQDLQANVVFLVVTEPRLIDLIQNGWSHPRISYNKLMNLVKFNSMVAMRGDGVMDETLALCEYDTADAVRDRTKKLRDSAEQFESGLAYYIASRGRVIVHSDIMEFVRQSAFPNPHPRIDQLWLQLGVMTYEAAQYAPPLTGVSADQTFADLVFRQQNAQPPIAALDLLGLPDITQLQPQYQQLYLEAIRVKATLAIQRLAKDGGPDALRKALQNLKKNPPLDGTSMVAQITGATGVDLHHDLSRQ